MELEHCDFKPTAFNRNTYTYFIGQYPVAYLHLHTGLETNIVTGTEE